MNSNVKRKYKPGNVLKREFRFFTLYFGSNDKANTTHIRFVMLSGLEKYMLYTLYNMIKKYPQNYKDI